MVPNTRREFLADVGRGMLVASVGSAVALDLGLSPAFAANGADVLSFGKLEPLAALLQDTPTTKLMSVLVGKIKEGTDLRTLVAAGSLANAREFGGKHYEGYHTFMALAPAYEMAKELPEAQRPLPVLKVLYRNATHIQAKGGRKNEELHPVKPLPVPTGKVPGEALQEATQNKDVPKAEGMFATIAQGSPDDAFNHVIYCVEDEVNVHRVVLAWRAWAMLDFTGPEHAHTLLRQSVLFCCNEGGRRQSLVQTLLPKLFDQHKLAGKKPGTREGDDAWVEALANTVYGASREQAAGAVAAAIAEGFSPASINEAISLAANRLLLCDSGRPKADGFKQIGSVHGDSVGLHASDAANAWRNISRVSNTRNTIASLIIGAYHTAGQVGPGQHKVPYHTPELEKITATDPAALLKQTEAAIRAGNQPAAAAAAQKYGEGGHPARALLDILLRYGTSEDGALHAEKYYRTATEEFAVMRPAFRWRQLVALTRVTASEHGRTTPGYDEAKTLLGV